MRSRQQFISAYAESHQNLVNEIIHIICVPAIFFCTAGLAWSVPIGTAPAFVPPGLASWWNLASLAFIPVAIFYARLGFGTLLTGLCWIGLTLLGLHAMQSAGLPMLWICLAAWIVAWIIQVYGHKVEGAKPSFVDDLVFLLIGPLFVTEKLFELLRTGSLKTSAH